MISRKEPQENLASQSQMQHAPPDMEQQGSNAFVQLTDPSSNRMKLATSQENALSPPPTPSLLNVPGAYETTESTTGQSCSRAKSPDHDLAIDKNVLSNADVTPPTSTDLRQALHSRQSSTVAESFRTANESPWLSRDELLQEDEMHGNAATAPLPLNGHSRSQIQPHAAMVAASTPSHNSLNDSHARIKTSPSYMKAPPSSVDVTRSRRSPSTAQQIASPKTPTTISTPVKLSSPRSSRKSGSIGSYDSPNRRSSVVSSRSSTIIEAIVISSASPKPQKLRHVGKAAALRDADDHSPDQTPSRRAVSDSGVFEREDRIAKAVVPTAVAQTKGSNDRQPVRIVTEPGRAFETSRALTETTAADRSPRQRNSIKASHTPVRSPFVQAHPDIVQPLMYMPLSALPRFPTWSQSTANNATFSYKHRTSSHASRGSDTSTATIRSLDETPQTTVSDIGYYGIDPKLERQSTTANGSLVTVIRQPVVTPAEPIVESRKPLAAKPTQHDATSSIDDQSHGQVPYEGLSINADHSSDVASNIHRASSDHLILPSEDHPKQLISQSTPFSQMSYTPIQLNEATAVNIYPHHNGSILVVDQAMKQNQEVSKFQKNGIQVLGSTQGPSAPKISIEPSTPPNKSSELNAVDSPLRNPRAAPAPPKINVLPATPMRDDDNPLDAVPIGQDERPSVMTRARRYSDTLLPSFLTRNDSQRRRHSTMPKARQFYDRDRHLHPKWQPRDFWMNGSESDSDWDDEEPVDRLPPGGDTSEPPSHSKFMPRTLSRRLPAFRGTGGFLIGNSLNLERHGTNKRRHYVQPPEHFNGSRVSLRRESAEHYRPQSDVPPTQSRLRHRTSLSSLRSEQALKHLRAQHHQQRQQRRRRRRFRVFGLELEYVGVAGLRDRWNDQRLAKEHKRAEKRRDEIRKSIGPKFLVENQLDSAGGTTTATSIQSPASTPATALVPIDNHAARLAPLAAAQA